MNGRFTLRGVLLVAATWLGVAAAQDVTGTVTGTVAGEERSWNTNAQVRGDQVVNTASFLGDEYTSITILGQTEPRVSSVTQGAFMLSLEMYGRPENCPCTFEDANLVYFAQPTMFQDFYEGDASLTFDTYERVDDDTYRATGSFTATVAHRKDPGTRPDPGDTLEVAGTFTIERLEREPE